MSVFNESSPNMSGMAKMPEECKPNYERMIEDGKERVVVAQALQDALLGYTDVHRDSTMNHPFTLPDLIGLLTLEIRDLRFRVSRDMEAWEGSKS